MRLTIVGPAYPLRGGIAHHVHALRRALTSRGHPVQVISFRRLYPMLLFPGRTTFDPSRLRLEADAVPVLDPLNPLTWSRANRLITAFGPAAVVLQWWNPFFALSLGSLARMLRRRGLRCIAECHNVIPHEPSAVDLPLLRYALDPIDRFITHSASDRDELLSIRPGAQARVAALPEIAEFQGRSTGPRNGRTILFFGLVRKYKGLDVLLEAMPEVLKRFACRLVIAGEFYGHHETYEQIIQRLGIARCVQVDNRYIANEEVPAYFDSADVLVMPYRSATQSAIARIAAVNGLPIIATRAGGLAEAVRDGVDGLLVMPGDSRALAQALIRYFEQGLGPIFSGNLRAARLSDAGGGIATAVEALAR